MSFIELYNQVLKTYYTSYDELPFPIGKKNYRKGEVITRYGQVEDTLYFMNSGIVEMTIKSYMSEKIVDFFFENEFFVGLTSFLNQIPSDVQITALSDCEVETITHTDLLRAYDHSFEANKFGRIQTEYAYIRKSNREKGLLTKTAEERYACMLESHIKYIANMPVNKIAKYLGIHPESLSRIRKKMNS